jgi:choline dehydrogenase-like flavoprotein
VTPSAPHWIPQDPEADLWDVVVIGTGAGGATAGFSLAQRGRSVLFLERGPLREGETTASRSTTPFVWNGDAGAALNHGWWPSFLFWRQNATERPVAPPVGCGSGGSMALFSMLMDRFPPEDFTPRRYAPATCRATVPETWPITYETLRPFYEEAERLFRVRGTHDPLSKTRACLLDPPRPSDKETGLVDAMAGAGLHPYRMHRACEHLPECTGCWTMLCPRECRNDPRRICLRPAIEQHGARLVPDCRVVRLDEDQRVVTRARCEWNGRDITVRGRVFVLAANGFFTPALLQRSANERFPDGLANSSGLMGRNLMLHVSDLFALRFKTHPPGADEHITHGISLNDFCAEPGMKMGSVHAHAFASRLVGSYGTHNHRTSTAFCSIVEDFPYAEHRVLARTGTADGVTYEYRCPDELRQRSTALFKKLKAAVASRLDVQLLQPLGQLNGKHVCGTCRFGDNPATSVLDPWNRAHDLDNLYIVDGSFLPSSGSTSPSLTIAANSLRVSEAIDRRL